MSDVAVRRAEHGRELDVRYRDNGDGTYSPATEVPAHAVAAENNANSDVVYLGLAPIGSSKAAAVWQIRKFSYDAGGGLTDVQWADGNGDYDNVWNDRAALAYS